MRYRTLPRTDVAVSEVGFGVWTLATGWWGDKDDREAVDLLRAALAQGITLYDTADSYGNGRGETILADAFEGRRDEVVYSTKVGYDWYTHSGPRGQRELPHDWTPAFVRRSCERSLERLGTDRIDVYQLHNPRMDAIRSDELFATLEDLVAEGKVRTYGVSLGPKIGWRDEGLAALATRPITSLTMIHNVLEQDPGRDLIEGAREADTGLFVRVPHSSGMLEGKYTTETTFPPSDHRSHRPRSWLLEGIQKIEALRFLTDDRPQTLGQAALKWLLAEPLVMTTLPNIYSARAARGVRRRARPAGPVRRGPGPDRRAPRRELRRRAGGRDRLDRQPGDVGPHHLVGAVLALGQGRGQPLGQPLGRPGRAGAALHVPQGLDEPVVEAVLHLHQGLGGAQEAPVGAHQPLLEGRRAVELGHRGERPGGVVAPPGQLQGPGGDDLQGLGHLGRVAPAGEQAPDGPRQVAQGGRVDQRLELLPEQARGRRLAHLPGVARRRQAGVQAEERGALERAQVASAPVRRLHGPHPQGRAPRDRGRRVAGRAEVLHQRPQRGLVGRPARHAAAMSERASAAAASAISCRPSTSTGSAHRPRCMVPASDTAPTRSAWRCPISASE